MHAPTETAILEELKAVFSAGYPLVFLFTVEEQRSLRLLNEAGIQLGKKLVFPRIKGESLSISDMLLKTHESECLVILDSAHYRLTEGESIRALADAAMGDQPNRTVVIVCPWVEIPVELERISATIVLPLPDENLLQKILDDVFSEENVLFSPEQHTEWLRILRGMTVLEAYRATKKAILLKGGLFEESRAVLIEEKKVLLRKSSVLENIDISSEMNEIGGMDRLKNWLIERKDAFSKEAEAFGLGAPRGLLLMGVQGCGKSLMAKAVARHWKLPLARLDLSAVFGARSPEASLREALITAEAMAPMVLWIDEIEKVFDKQSSGVGTRILGRIVTWLQEKKQEVFVAATANRVSDLPPELPRKGRFDEVFFVDLPDVEERTEILKIHLSKRGRNPEVFALAKLAEKTDKFTGSELEQIITAGLFQAFAAKRELQDEDLFWAAKETVPLFEMYEDELKALREWARKRARPASTDKRKANLFAGASVSSPIKS